MNRLLYVSLYYDIWPLALSFGVPEESGVRRPLVSHHSMELTAHPLPAPGRLLLEAKQFLRECFFFWRRLLCFHRILRASLTLLDAGGTGVPSSRFCFGESRQGMRRPNHCIGGEIRATYRIPLRWIMRQHGVDCKVTRWLKRWWGHGSHLCALRFLGNCENRIPKRELYQARLAFWGEV